MEIFPVLHIPCLDHRNNYQHKFKLKMMMSTTKRFLLTQTHTHTQKSNMSTLQILQTLQNTLQLQKKA